MLNTISSRNPSIPNIETEVDLSQIHSQTEKTIREYHPPGNTLQDYIPLVKGNDGKFYPKNPHYNYVSRFSEGFRGCLGYGSVGHLFRVCPDKASTGMKQITFKIFGLAYLPLGIPQQIYIYP